MTHFLLYPNCAVQFHIMSTVPLERFQPPAFRGQKIKCSKMSVLFFLATTYDSIEILHQRLSLLDLYEMLTKHVDLEFSKVKFV